MAAGIVFLIIGLIVLGILISPVLTRWRRQRLQKRPFPPHWLALVEQYVPIYTKLAVAERRRLQGYVHVFLSEKQFIGCDGLAVTEEMRLTIAAVSCVLLLNERGNYFPKLKSVLIYPNEYAVDETTSNGFYIEEKRVTRLGESWTRDQLVLSWQQIQFDAHHWNDGHNLILHEFAHQLDQANDEAEGVPVLSQKAEYSRWAQVMNYEFQRLYTAAQQGLPTVMDSYGATNPAEFFAVATETFFEKPNAMHRKHTALYELLRDFYKLDPMQWC